MYHSESESLGGGERKEILSHLGHCWAKPAGAAPKGVIAPILRNARRTHSESESLGGGERKETRKQYGSTISCIWGEAVDGMRILWRPYSQSYFWAEPPKIMLGRKPVSTR